MEALTQSPARFEPVRMDGLRYGAYRWKTEAVGRSGWGGKRQLDYMD